jgi:hypothetical protein
MQRVRWAGVGSIVIAAAQPAAAAATPCSAVQAQLKPGVVVKIDEGATCTQQFTLPAGAGLEGEGAGATLQPDPAGRAVTAKDGGAIVLRNLTIRGHSPADGSGGGGVLITGAASVEVTKVRFDGNVGATGSGGGLSATATGDITVTGSAFTGNSTTALNGGGGAAFLSGANVRVEGSTFDKNVLTPTAGTGGGAGSGGALYAIGSTSVRLTDNDFTANKVSGGRFISGGAVAVTGPALLLRNAYVGNELLASVPGSGSAVAAAGVCSAAPAVISLVDEQIFGNVAGTGAAVNAACADLRVVNSTIGRNTATSGARSLNGDDKSTLTLQNSIVDEYPTATITGCASRAFAFSDVCRKNAPLKGEGNICLNALLDTKGHLNALGETYDSPTIDGGSNALVGPEFTTDNEGLVRMFDGDGDGTAEVDMGASEFQVEGPVGGKPVIFFGGTPVAVKAGKTYRVRTGWTVHCQRGGSACPTTVNGRRGRRLAAGSFAQPTFKLTAKQAKAYKADRTLSLRITVTARAGTGAVVRAAPRVTLTA